MIIRSSAVAADNRHRLLGWSLTASLAGFLFGFDTVVISGAEQAIQQLWGLSDDVHGLVVSMALWGTVVGSLFAGWPTDRFGRRTTLLSIGVLYSISAVWSALAGDAYALMIARGIGGLGVGLSTVVAPLYISEIAPPDRRGRLAGLFQLNIVLGILLALLSNFLLGAAGADAWRWMLGSEAVPALAYTLLCLTIPESPRWLIVTRGDRAAGVRALALVTPSASAIRIERLADDIEAASRPATTAGETIWRGALRTPTRLAILIACFNQLSGISAIVTFAPRIFALTGLAERAALLQTVGIGFTNLVFTFVGLWLIDRAGRRTLLAAGSVGYIVSLGICAWAFFTERFAIVPACIFAFIAAHAMGQGAVIWVFISEIFPDRHRATGQALGSFTHWFVAATLALVFPRVVSTFPPGYIFSFFCGVMVLQLAWVVLRVPETAGVPLERLKP